MKFTSKILIYFLIGVISIRCSKDKEFLSYGAITEEGIYRSTALELVVKVDDNLVSFGATDINGRHLFSSVHSFSSLHNWVLYLDKDGNLWVLSSDIGYSTYKKDSVGRYEYSELSRRLTKSDVPGYLYNDLKDAIKFR